MNTNSLLSILLVSFCCVFSSKAQNSGNGKDGVLCSSTDLSATLLKAAGKVSGTAVEGSDQFVSDIQSLLESLLFQAYCYLCFIKLNKYFFVFFSSSHHFFILVFLLIPPYSISLFL